MNEKHVPDLEHCQELDRLCKENNITLPETEFYWDAVAGGSIEIVKAPSASSNITNKERCHDELSNISIPAPLVSEQGEWLPWTLAGVDIGGDVNVSIEFQKVGDTHGVMYVENNETLASFKDGFVEQWDTTEANARMKCLSYLIAEGIITTL